MSNGDWTSYMPETGAHNDIGPLPRNTAMYLISQDARAKTNVLANGTTAGSYQVHYRDKDKLKPLFIDDYPYVTIQGNVGDTYNPLTKKSEAFPTVTGGLDVYTPDHAHQPSMAYIPYMISGDYFYLEELQFWATWNMVLANPGYRLGKMGLLKWGQERAQAWSMRTLGDAAYITPDSDPLKGYFVEKIKNNIDWYAQTFSNPATKEINSLGWLPGGLNSAAYPPFGIATWQDDFFTYSIGHLLSLGFTSARALIDWKGKFVVGRLSDPGYCWLYAAPYTLQLKPEDGLTVYGSFTALFKANFPDSTCSGLVMKGYPEIGTGYPANMQPELAMAVDAGLPSAAAAWAKYQTRNPKQDYTKDPQFDIIPGGPLLNTAIKKVSSKRLGSNSTPLELHQNPTTQVLRLKKNGVENIYDAKGGSRIEK